MQGSPALGLRPPCHEELTKLCSWCGGASFTLPQRGTKPGELDQKPRRIHDVCPGPGDAGLRDTSDTREAELAVMLLEEAERTEGSCNGERGEEDREGSPAWCCAAPAQGGVSPPASCCRGALSAHRRGKAGKRGGKIFSSKRLHLSYFLPSPAINLKGDITAN